MDERSERERMLAGELYLASDPELVELRRRARRLSDLYNASAHDRPEDRAALLADLLGGFGADCEIEPPFRCDYGFNIRAGRRLYINFGCVVLDCASVTFGDNVLIGPSVQIYAATHPTSLAARRSGRELARPVSIGSDVWIGGGAIVGPGVSIGNRAVIGAGSVVLRDVPAGSLAAGNPCRVISVVS